MIELVQHLWRENREEIVEKSLFHCHVRDVHSIMLLDAPEKRIRLFVAWDGNDLCRNSTSMTRKGVPLSIAYHPHHCNVTLKAVVGHVENIQIVPSEFGPIELRKYLYTSQILNGEMRFEPQELCRFKVGRRTILGAGRLCKPSVYMPASAIHTVCVIRRRFAAWIVFEGKEDPTYQPFCYSNWDISTLDASDLYLKPCEQDVKNMLVLCGLLTGLER